MRLRSFVMYFWSITMFIFAAFGTFYLISGQNIITGQSKNAVNVLPAHTENVGSGESNNKEKDNKKRESKDLVVFNEVMSKTSSDKSYKLETTDKADNSVVYIRFGKDGDNYYVATYGSGLSTDNTYSVWLTSDEENLKLGKLKLVDETDVLKLGYTTKDDITGYKGVVIAVGDSDTFDELKQTHTAEVDINFKSSNNTPIDEQKSTNSTDTSNKEENTGSTDSTQ